MKPLRLLKRRYVAFVLDNPPYPSRRELLTTLGERAAEAPAIENQQPVIRLIFYDQNSGHGIFRCDHKTLPALKGSAELSIGKSIRTIKTSGTLKALRKNLG